MLDAIPTIGIGQITKTAIVPGISLLRSMHLPDYIDGQLPYNQLSMLLTVLLVARPRVILEIGTYIGRTTKLMADILPGATVHTVDLPPSYRREGDTITWMPKDDYHLIDRRDRGRDFWGYEGRIIQHYADTALWDFREASNVEFIFIDGSHTYGYCWNDSSKAIDVILERGAGTIMWHDVDESHPGVLETLSELRRLDLDIRRITGFPLGYLKIDAKQLEDVSDSCLLKKN